VVHRSVLNNYFFNFYFILLLKTNFLPQALITMI